MRPGARRPPVTHGLDGGHAGSGRHARPWHKANRHQTSMCALESACLSAPEQPLLMVPELKFRVAGSLLRWQATTQPKSESEDMESGCYTHWPHRGRGDPVRRRKLQVEGGRAPEQLEVPWPALTGTRRKSGGVLLFAAAANPPGGPGHARAGDFGICPPGAIALTRIRACQLPSPARSRFGLFAPCRATAA